MKAAIIDLNAYRERRSLEEMMHLLRPELEEEPLPPTPAQLAALEALEFEANDE